jgi:hypothetical protein
MIQIHMYLLLSLYGLIALSMGSSIVLFLTLKKDIRRSENRHRRQQVLLQESFDRVEAGMETMKATVQEMEEKATNLVAPSPARSGMNLNKRAQATRMFRRGDRPEQIAAALGLPQSEIDLLLKVQEAALGMSA